MPQKRPIGAISFGIFLVTCGVAGLLYATKLATLWETPAVVAILSGMWLLVLAAIKQARPERYEISAFATGIWGTIVLGGGLSWLLAARTSVAPGLALFVVIVGISAVAAGAREWGGKK